MDYASAPVFIQAGTRLTCHSTAEAGAAAALTGGSPPPTFTLDFPTALAVPRAGSVALLGPEASGRTAVLRALLAAAGVTPAAAASAAAHLEPPQAAKGQGLVACAADACYVPAGDAALRAGHSDEVVEEALATRARLSAEDGWERRVAEAVRGLGLARVRRARLGTLSGGELRRVALALAAVADARVLLVDGATAGLDSHTAEGAARYLAALPAAVVVVADQPSFALAGAFDSVVVLAKRDAAHAEAAFVGPAAGLLAWARDGWGCPCPPLENPVDAVLAACAKLAEDCQGDPAAWLKALPTRVGEGPPPSATTPPSSPLAPSLPLSPLSPSPLSPSSRVDVEVAVLVPSGGARTTLAPCSVLPLLLLRHVRRTILRGAVVRVRLARALLFGLAIGALVWRQDGGSSASVDALRGALFLLAGESQQEPLLDAVRKAAGDAAVADVECGEKRLYPRWVGVAASMVFEAALQTVITLVFLLPVYCCVGMVALWQVYPVLLAVAVTARHLGVLIAAVVPAAGQLIVASLVNFTLVITVGYLAPAGTMPLPLRWMHDALYLPLAYKALAVTQFGFGRVLESGAEGKTVLHVLYGGGGAVAFEPAVAALAAWAVGATVAAALHLSCVRNRGK
eukprot:Rhum_TRINITY_DN16435_c0_g1::Rhum_TRINITY_DN16435_c0_g1_i1::g.163167::m.163167